MAINLHFFSGKYMQKRFETADRHSVTNKIHEGKNLKNLVNVYKFRCWVWFGLVGFVACF